MKIIHLAIARVITVLSNRGCRIINYDYVNNNMLRYHVNNYITT